MTAVHEYWFLFFFSTVISSPSYSWWSNRENDALFSYFLDMVQKEFLNLKGISQQKLSPWKSFSSLLCEVSPIFYELYVFFLPWPKCNEFFGYSSSCWSCKVCKKLFCGFEKCLVSKVVFYIMLDVAWNSVVVVLLLGFCGLKKIGEQSLFSRMTDVF